MKIARLTWPREATAPSAGRSAPRSHRHGVEYGLVLAIACFATISTVNAISAKHGSTENERVAVGYQ